MNKFATLRDRINMVSIEINPTMGEKIDPTRSDEALEAYIYWRTTVWVVPGKSVVLCPADTDRGSQYKLSLKGGRGPPAAMILIK